MNIVRNHFELNCFLRFDTDCLYVNINILNFGILLHLILTWNKSNYGFLNFSTVLTLLNYGLALKIWYLTWQQNWLWYKHTSWLTSPRTQLHNSAGCFQYEKKNMIWYNYTLWWGHNYTIPQAVSNMKKNMIWYNH